MAGVNQPRTEIIALDILRESTVIWKAPKNSDGTITVCIKDKKLHVTFNIINESEHQDDINSINGVNISVHHK